MTEAEWLACTDPQRMLEFLRGKASERKMRLFACACCRRSWHLLTDERSREVIEVAELWADRQIAYEKRVEARQMGAAVTRAYEGNPGHFAHYLVADAATCTASADIQSYLHSVLYGLDRAVAFENNEAASKEKGCRASLFSDIFGNPFRPVATNPSWLAWNDRTVQRIAQVIYDERAFDRMPILADALEEAGCTNQDILAHCRGEGPHVRGCWVVDLVLGKS